MHKVLHHLLIAWALVFWVGCGPTDSGDDDTGVEDSAGDSGGNADGTLGGACLPDNTCNDGLRCTNGQCVPCPEGEAGCDCGPGDACDPGLSCSAGTCENDACAADPGSAGCACSGPGDCDPGLSCESNLCVTCSSDTIGCPCDAGACGGDLVCGDDDTCRSPLTCANDRTTLGCVARQLCEDGAAGEDAACIEDCEGGFEWNAQTDACDAIPNLTCADIDTDCEDECRVCDPGTGSGASCGGCDTASGCYANGAVCTPGPLCADLDCEATAFRACTPNTGTAPAACSGDCIDNYVLDGGACVPDPSCANPVNAGDCADQLRECVDVGGVATCGDCLDGATPINGECPNNGVCLSLGCAALNRFCPTGSGQAASCGDCKPNYVPTGGVNDACELDEEAVCASAGCGSDQVCLVDDQGVASCVTATCGPGTYVSEEQSCQDTVGTSDFELECCLPDPCVATTCTADGAGEPVRDGNSCFCGADEGYFPTAEGNGVLACDKDGDGWTNRTLIEVLEAGGARAEEAGCAVHEVAEVVLLNELGDTYTIDAVDLAIAAGVGPSVLSFELYESGDLDGAGDLTGNDYQYNGRAVADAEINSLTKGCATQDLDLNDNGNADYLEHPELAPTETYNQARWQELEAIYALLTHFSELHVAWFEEDDSLVCEGQDTVCGRYIIAERSRLATAAAIDQIGPIYPADAGDHWQVCPRRTLQEGREIVGFDLSDWNPAAGETWWSGLFFPGDLNEEFNPDGDNPPGEGIDRRGAYGGPVPAGLALLGVDSWPTEEALWRGMTHHSQFLCARIVPTLPAGASDEAEDVTLAHGQVDVSEDYHVNTPCTLGAASTQPVSDPRLPGVPVDGPNPRATSFVCDVETDPSNVDGVRWLATKFQPYDASSEYERGCVDEGVEAAYMCPGAGSGGVVPEGAVGNSGRLTCGCGFNFGGPNCEVGCPDDFVLVGGRQRLNGGAEPEAADVANWTCRTPDGELYDGAADTDGTVPDDLALYCTTRPEELGGNGTPVFDGGRSGFWMCAAASTTSYDGPPVLTNEPTDTDTDTDVPDVIYTLRGEVPEAPISGVLVGGDTDVDTDDDPRWTLTPTFGAGR